VAADHHQLSAVDNGDSLDGPRGALDEAGPAVRPAGDGALRTPVPVRRAETLTDLLPGQPIGLSWAELGELLVGLDRDRRTVAPMVERGSEDLGGLDRPGEHRRVQAGHPGKLPAPEQALGECLHLRDPTRGEPRAPAHAAHDATHVALCLTMTDQHHPGRADLVQGRHDASPLAGGDQTRYCGRSSAGLVHSLTTPVPGESSTSLTV